MDHTPLAGIINVALETPILFCIFNRPNLTRQVFKSIAAQRPKQLLVVGDGARTDHAKDTELVRATRDIINRVDWECDIRTNFSDTNLGCKQRMATGITWAFAQFERLIILEDDCLPSHSFFSYCESLLDKYADDERIMTISGDNFQHHRRGPYSYYFSKWTHIWGWASWRRAWKHFDVDISNWTKLKKGHPFKDLCCDANEQKHWRHIFDQQHAGKIDTWDFPWMYANWVNNGLTILPNRNLVSNLGFGSTATHTVDPDSNLSNLSRHELTDLKHPQHVIRDTEADGISWHQLFKPPVQTPPNKPPSNPGSKWLPRFLRDRAA